MASNKTASAPNVITRETVLRWFRHGQNAANPVWSPFARWAIRGIFSKLGAQIPKWIATADVNALADALVKEATSRATNVADMDAMLKEKYDKFVDDEPIVRVDNVLRNTDASDMPINCRVVLRTLAGHASNENKQECWVSRATLAGECGLSEPTLDRAIADLAGHGWIKKTHRFTSSAEAAAQTSSRYQIRSECGRWWDPTERLRKNRTPPVRQANTVPTMAAIGEKELDPATEAAASPTPPAQDVQVPTATAPAPAPAPVVSAPPMPAAAPSKAPVEPWTPSKRALDFARDSDIDIAPLLATFGRAYGDRLKDPSQHTWLETTFINRYIGPAITARSVVDDGAF